MRFRENGNIGLGASNGGWGGISGGNPAYAIDTKGTLYNNTDVRAPIYYDSDNVAYYLNPAGSSNLNSATFAGNSSFNGNLGIGVAAHATASLNITNSNQHIRLNNGSELGIITLLSSGELDIWAHGTDETINFRTGTGSGTVQANITGSTATFAGDVAVNGGELKVKGDFAKILFEDTAGTDLDAYIVNNANGLFFGKTNSPSVSNDILSLNLSTKASTFAGSIVAGTNPDTTPEGTAFSHTFSSVGTSNNRVINFETNGTSISTWYSKGNVAYSAIDNSSTTQSFWRNAGAGWQKQMDIYRGYVQSVYSFRAPIFYDSDNTAFYIDPSNGSNGVSANLQGRIQVGTFGIGQTNSGEAWIGRASDRAAGTLTVQLGTGSGRKFEVVDSGWTTVEFSAHDDGNAYAASSFRAPIFYDSNNTAFYLNPASTSNLNAVDINGSLTVAGDAVFSGDVYGKSVNNDHSKLYRFGGIFFTWDSDSYGTQLNHSITSTSNGVYGDNITMNSYGKVRINFDSNNNDSADFSIGTHTTGASNTLLALDSAGSCIVVGDVRSPIFYDSADTSYYVNPNAGSEIYDLKLKGAAHKYLEIDPDGNYESMVRYMGASGSDWYVGKRTATSSASNSGISTSDYHFYSAAAGKTVGGVTSNGGIHAQYFGFTVGDPAATYTYNDTTTRSKVYVSSQYPVLTLNVNTNTNTNHGGTLQFVASGYDSNAQWVIGSGGTCQFLDFGFGQPSNKNPHVGIAGYQGKTMMRMIKSGKVGIGGNWGTYGSGDPSYDLDVLGTMRASSDVIAFSDKRVKENIKTINNALDKVTKLRGVTYTRKDIEDKSIKVGVIAQEVLEVLPEVVNQDDKGMYSVAYGNIVGVLIEAVKEQQKQINELTNIIDKLNK